MSEENKTNKNDLSLLLGIQPSNNNDHNTQLWGMACNTSDISTVIITQAVPGHGQFCPHLGQASLVKPSNPAKQAGSPHTNRSFITFTIYVWSQYFINFLLHILLDGLVTQHWCQSPECYWNSICKWCPEQENSIIWCTVSSQWIYHWLKQRILFDTSARLLL